MQVTKSKCGIRGARRKRLVQEMLEPRFLLCADVASHAALSEVQHSGMAILAKYDTDGDQHLTLDQYHALSPLEQSQLDPHMILDSRFDGPIDFDKLLGIPQGGASEDIRLPDFFPQLDSAIFLDQTSQPGRTLARFGTRVNNQGLGPAILISGRPGIDPIPTGAPITNWVNPDGSQNVLQALYDYNGTTFFLSQYRAAGRFTYHSGHGHFHFDGYAFYRLRHSVGGQPGPYVTRADGTGVVGEKVGFCLINTSSSFTMENGQSSTTLPTYNKPGQPNTGCGFLQGVHVGKSDQYGSSLEGQWIDVTGVPNGSYFLELSLDGENGVLETNEDNNSKNFPFTLNANPPAGGIPPDVFDTGGNNNTFENATDFGELGVFTQTGLTIHWGADYDFFKFRATSSGTYSITSTQASGNVDLFLYDANRNLLASSTNPSGTETVTHAFVKGQTYFVKTEAYNSTTSSNYQVAWNIKPEVNSAVQGDNTIIEGNRRRGIFAITRNGPTTTPLTVNFTLTGTAVPGADYYDVPRSIVLGDLQSTGYVEILAIPDRTVEGLETVILTITSNNAYVVGSTVSTIFITDAGAAKVGVPNGNVPVQATQKSALENPFQAATHRRVAEVLNSILRPSEKEYREAVELLFSR